MSRFHFAYKPTYIRTFLQVGKDFDALLIDVEALGSQGSPVFDIFEDSFDVCNVIIMSCSRISN